MTYKRKVAEGTGTEPDTKPSIKCLRCGADVAWITASTYGGRCGHCYGDFTREPQHHPHTGKKTEPLSWAFALKARHEAGERLSKAQIDAYVQALRLNGPVPRAQRHIEHDHLPQAHHNGGTAV